MIIGQCGLLPTSPYPATRHAVELRTGGTLATILSYILCIVFFPLLTADNCHAFLLDIAAGVLANNVTTISFQDRLKAWLTDQFIFYYVNLIGHNG